MSNIRVLLISLALFFSAEAQSCPDGQYEVCFIGCACVPNSGEVIRQAQRPINEAITQLTGPAFERWLIESRNSASRGGTSRIPNRIRSALLRYYSPQVLDAARYKVGDNGIINASHVTFLNPSTAATTLIDIIVFRFQEDAEYNTALWAHELKHVQQFQEWGTRDFALRYIRNNGAAENPAYDIERIVDASRNINGSSFVNSGPPPFIPTGLPRGTVMQNCGCWGFNGSTVAPESRCESGRVQLTTCQAICAGGGSQFGWLCE